MKYLNFIAFVGFSCMFWNCGDKHAPQQETTFSKVDSLTEFYLSLQDSMLLTWNLMIHDDNEKIKAMHNLIHELMVSNPGKREELAAYEERLGQLERLRYTPKTMANNDVVEEYDFASNTLVAEIVALAESQAEFAYNSTLQKLTDKIREADQRMASYREDYDAIVVTYNAFLEKNKNYLHEIDENSSFEKRPMFQMVADE